MPSRSLINSLFLLEFLLVLGLGVLVWHSARQPLPRVEFNCAYELSEYALPRLDESLFQLPKREPFFPPALEVSVSMAVEEEVKRVHKQASLPFSYKGMMVWGEEKIAIIYSSEDKRDHFLKLGEFIGGYKLLDITEDAVVLSKKGGLSLITLKKAGGLGED